MLTCLSVFVGCEQLLAAFLVRRGRSKPGTGGGATFNKTESGAFARLGSFAEMMLFMSMRGEDPGRCLCASGYWLRGDDRYWGYSYGKLSLMRRCRNWLRWMLSTINGAAIAGASRIIAVDMVAKLDG